MSASYVWPMDGTWPTSGFCIAYKLKNGVYIFKWLERKIRLMYYDMKIICNSF